MRKALFRQDEEKISSLIKERDEVIKHRDFAIREALLWRTELGKARERVVILEGAIFWAKEKVGVTEVDVEVRIKEAAQRGAAAVKEKQELLAYVNMLQSQLKSQQVDDAKQVFEKKTESCSSNANNLPETKHMDPSEENVDKACLNISKAIEPVPTESVVHQAVDQTNHQPIGDSEWSDIQPTKLRIADVREVAPGTDGSIAWIYPLSLHP